ncbi:DUF5958 family protein [Streptomyces sp. NPDC049555]|uniref:DUF5958 family protein n=1 Tax=Streptomyces sp. NPDC049555 TaxID=3154930 RepID=UPI003434D74C
MAKPFLGRVAQGLRPISQGIAWFNGLNPVAQAKILRHLAQYCIQARPAAEDRTEGIRRAGLRTTHTPAVLITRGRIDQQLGKIACLTPLDERRKAFRLLIAILAIADQRRRERICLDGCSHWWHKLPPPDCSLGGHGSDRTNDAESVPRGINSSATS